MTHNTPARSFSPGIGEVGVYTITNTVNQRCYVGSTINTRTRFNGHRGTLRRGKHASRFLQRAWDKYGEAAFTFEVIEAVGDPSQLLSREQFHVDRLNPDYNVCKVVRRGRLGVKPSVETRQKIGEANRKRSPESRARMSAAQRLRKHPPEHVAKVIAALLARTPEQKKNCGRAWIGRHHTEESKSIMRTKALGRVIPEEQRAKISKSLTGKTHSAETKKKMSESHKARRNNRHVESENVNV